MSTSNTSIEWKNRTWKPTPHCDERVLTALLRWRKPTRVKLGFDLFDSEIPDSHRAVRLGQRVIKHLPQGPVPWNYSEEA